MCLCGRETYLFCLLAQYISMLCPLVDSVAFICICLYHSFHRHFVLPSFKKKNNYSSTISTLIYIYSTPASVSSAGKKSSLESPSTAYTQLYIVSQPFYNLHLLFIRGAPTIFCQNQHNQSLCP